MKSITENRLHPVPPYDASVIAEETGNGFGFYTACKNEQMLKMKPARSSLNELAKAFKLLSLPENVCGCGVKGACAVLRLEKILVNSATVVPDRDREGSVSQFRSRIYSLIEASAGTGVELPEGAALNDGSTPLAASLQQPDGGTDVSVLDDGQKHLLYNMLIANGCSPKEAKAEIEGLGV